MFPASIRRFLSRRVVLGLAVAVASLTLVESASADEKYTIKPSMAANVAATFETSADSNVNITQGANQQQVQITMKREGSLVVKDVAGGQPSAIEVTFGPNCTIKQTAGGQQQEQKSPLAGKTVNLKKDANGRVTHDAGNLAPDAEAELTKMLDQDTAFYPPNAVAVGDEWAVDPAKLQALIPVGVNGKADVKCKLAKIGEVRGRATYDIVVTGSIFAEQNGGKINVTLGGVVQVDRQYGMPIQQDLVVKMNGGDANQQVAMQMAMSGGFSIKGGAPAPAPVVVPGPIPGPNPLEVVADAPFSGQFKGERVSAEFTTANGQINGFIIMGQKRFPATAKVDGAKATGTFEVDGNKFDFVATAAGNTLTIESGGARHTATKIPLARPEPKVKNPLE